VNAGSQARRAPHTRHSFRTRNGCPHDPLNPGEITVSTLFSTRLHDDYARSVRQLAELRRTSVSDVLARLVVEQIAPMPADPAIRTTDDELDLDGAAA
jgi:hypothetical protein